MAKNKQTSSAGAAEKQLKAVVKKLRAQLAAAERSAEKWRSRAKDHKALAAGARSELTAVRRRLDKAQASAAKWKSRATSAPRAAAGPAPGPTRAASAEATAVPDESWTVTALRAEARSRGLPGYSRKSKAQLLAELRG